MNTQHYVENIVNAHVLSITQETKFGENAHDSQGAANDYTTTETTYTHIIYDTATMCEWVRCSN